MITVTLYYRSGCSACDEVEHLLIDLQKDYPHQLVRVNVETDAALEEAYGSILPVVTAGPYKLKQSITRQELQMTLGAASDRHNYLEKTDSQYQQRLERGHSLSGFDKFSYWFSRNYVILLNLLVLIYVGIPFLAPVFMKAGFQAPARLIYTIYSPLCHQFAFRSYFLFGEQTYYPRALAEIPGVIPYEQIAGVDSSDIYAARAFLGNEQVGYKVALCERDVAIYGAIFLFGVIFMLTGRRIKPINLLVAMIIGLVPIGIDGVSQLPGITAGTTVNLPDWLPLRESTPLLRTITGGLFGLMAAWIIYPLIEESMRETRRLLSHKMAVVKQTTQPQ